MGNEGVRMMAAGGGVTNKAPRADKMKAQKKWVTALLVGSGGHTVDNG